MTDVGDIERAVAGLPPRDLAAFRAWFERFDAERFDRRIADDAAAGRLDRFAEDALAELRQGTIREL